MSGPIEGAKAYARAAKYRRLYRRAVSRADRISVAANRPVVRQAAFIIGCGRSGTTLLGKMLALHPDVRYFREPYHLWAAVDPITDSTGLYTPGPARCLLDRRDAGPTTRARFEALFGEERPSTNSLVVEKTPINALRIGFLEELTDDARYIHIVRDGCEVTQSIARLASTNAYRIAGLSDFNQWWGAGDVKWLNLSRDGRAAGYFTEEVDLLHDHTSRAAYEWLVSIAEVDRWRNELGSRLTEVGFAALVTRPRDVLTNAANALQLATNDAWLDACIRLVEARAHAEASQIALLPEMRAAFDSASERLGSPCRARALEVA
jgi:hypothetical protein